LATAARNSVLSTAPEPAEGHPSNHAEQAESHHAEAAKRHADGASSAEPHRHRQAHRPAVSNEPAARAAGTSPDACAAQTNGAGSRTVCVHSAEDLEEMCAPHVAHRAHFRCHRTLHIPRSLLGEALLHIASAQARKTGPDSPKHTCTQACGCTRACECNACTRAWCVSAHGTASCDGHRYLLGLRCGVHECLLGGACMHPLAADERGCLDVLPERVECDLATERAHRL
jgi:hypothetical protein